MMRRCLAAGLSTMMKMPMTMTMMLPMTMMLMMTVTVVSSEDPVNMKMHAHTAHHQHPDIQKTQTIINVTRYGNNLCHECTTTVGPCVVTKKYQCDQKDSDAVQTGKLNSTYLDLKDDNEDGEETDAADDFGGEMEMTGRRRRRRKRFAKNWWPLLKRTNSTSTSSSSSAAKLQPAFCTYNITKRCLERRCEMKCCDGSKMDPSTNDCKETENGGIVTSCLNGGTLSKDKSHCQCTDGFSGLRCQNRKCSMKCQNGGICQTRNSGSSGKLDHTTHNDDYCVCPMDTKGQFCEEKVCTLQCLNNGTCKTMKHSSWSHTWCKCKHGFYGTSCEKGGKKDGECPKRSSLPKCNRRRWVYECHEDDQCPDIKKCCVNSCNYRVCAYPNNDNATCMFKNQTYAMGTAFQPDACHLCTCNASHVGAPQGVIECARIRCPQMPKHCSSIVTKEGECCPACNEEPHVAVCAGNYSYPSFTNCPRKLTTLEVDGGDTNLASVDIGLRAVDCRGDPLDVRYSQDKVVAGRGEDNFQLLTATSERDARDNFAQCAFHIRIKDPYPPEYVTCPEDMVSQPGPVHWEVPVAKDNVGLSKHPISRRNPGIRLSVGQYAIQYITEDFHGNTAVCKFLITVKDDHSLHPDGDHSHEHPVNPAQQVGHHPDSPSHKSTAIGVGVATTLAVVVLVALAGFFWHRQRGSISNSNAGMAAGNPGPALRWNLNAGGGGGGVSVGGVPQYSLPPDEAVMSVPPVYSQVDDRFAGLVMASGGQEGGELPAKTSLA